MKIPKQIILYILLLLICSLEAKQKSSKRSEYHFFPKEECALNELESKAKQLKKEYFYKAEVILDKISRRTKKDPEILALKRKTADKFYKIADRYNPPYDKYRAGRTIEGLYINATEVVIKDQAFILASCPKTKAEVRDYFEAAFKEKAAVFVSLLQSFEAKSYANNFWKNKLLKKIELRSGIKIAQVSSKVIFERKKSRKKYKPQIIESTLTYDDQTCTHLHYEGWKDKTPAPCEKLLGALLDKICELSPDPTVPVSINCRGGVGRTGVLAVSLYLRREIDAELAKGTALEDITVNIPEAIYAFRKIRNSIVSTPAQMTQIYSITANYYESLKALQSRDHPILKVFY